jgi:invasion protein IalB
VGKVDDGEQFKFILQSCTQRGCQAAVEVSGTLKAAIKSGKRLVVAFKPRADGKTIRIPLSLKGITNGLRALKVR